MKLRLKKKKVKLTVLGDSFGCREMRKGRIHHYVTFFLLGERIFIYSYIKPPPRDELDIHMFLHTHIYYIRAGRI